MDWHAREYGFRVATNYDWARIQPSPAMPQRPDPVVDHGRLIAEFRVGAMCGRLRVGKSFLHVPQVVGAAMCSAY
jgi:hypothetical protein